MNINMKYSEKEKNGSKTKQIEVLSFLSDVRVQDDRACSAQ